MAASQSPPALLHLLLLVFSIVFGIYATWVMQFRNGFNDLMVHLRDVGPHILPGTVWPIKTEYVGHKDVDYFFTVLQCFFAPVFDSENRELQLICLEFAGVFGAVVGIMAIEGLRWKSWKLMAFTSIWAQAFQFLAFGATMPVYAVLGLLTYLVVPSQPSFYTTTNLTTTSLITLPFSLTLGYLLPTVLMSLPNLSSPMHQTLVIVWQFFPLYIATLQFVFSRLMQTLVAPTYTPASTISSLLGTYQFLHFLASLPHRAFIGLTLYIRFVGPPTSFSLLKLLVPASPYTAPRVSSFGDGALAFLSWDLINGILAFAILTWWLRESAFAKAKAVGAETQEDGDGSVLTFVLDGPGGLVVKWAKERDMALFLAEQQEVVEKRKTK